MCPAVVPDDPHALTAPSPWVVRWAPPLPAGARVLDVACGSDRHVRWLAARGLRVTGIDRDADTLSGLAEAADTLIADIEDGPWPLPAEAVFDAVVVTNYLYRPLWPRLLACVAPGGRRSTKPSRSETKRSENRPTRHSCWRRANCSRPCAASCA